MIISTVTYQRFSHFAYYHQISKHHIGVVDYHIYITVLTDVSSPIKYHPYFFFSKEIVSLTPRFVIFEFLFYFCRIFSSVGDFKS